MLEGLHAELSRCIALVLILQLLIFRGFVPRCVLMETMAAAAKGDGGAMKVAGLATLWEQSAEVRSTARERALLMKVPRGAAFCDCNRVNAVDNTAVLIPCLERMYENDLKLPYISPLQDEVDKFFKQVHVKASEKLAYRTAGEIKKMLSFLKRKANKKEVTKDLCNAWFLAVYRRGPSCTACCAGLYVCL